MNETVRQQLRGTPGLVLDLDETATHDGPGLRMAIYLKGCPLSCVWCHSPESVWPGPQIIRYRGRCIGCGRCTEVCPMGIRKLAEDASPDPSSCRLCLACVEVCPAVALELKGHSMEVGELVDRAVRQRAFYDASGGGVTISGGEPLLQAPFTSALARSLRAEGIHVAIETTGLAPWPVLSAIADSVDLFLYDVKQIDDQLHVRDTGVSNALLLDNLGRLTAAGSEVIVRVPCIPGHNDSPESIKAIALKVRELGGSRITLLRYNPAAPGKYSWVQRPYPLARATPQEPETMRELECIVSEVGLEVLPR